MRSIAIKLQIVWRRETFNVSLRHTICNISCLYYKIHFLKSQNFQLEHLFFKFGYENES